jgi:hypothetical protein
MGQRQGAVKSSWHRKQHVNIAGFDPFFKSPKCNGNDMMGFSSVLCMSYIAFQGVTLGFGNLLLHQAEVSMMFVRTKHSLLFHPCSLKTQL